MSEQETAQQDTAELEKGPRGLRRGRGARERILEASQQLFRVQGINRTGMDQRAVAQVSKRTAYQHFSGKDELVAEYLRRFDPDVMSGFKASSKQIGNTANMIRMGMSDEQSFNAAKRKVDFRMQGATVPLAVSSLP